jgi:uncharacterized protein YfbU (UPF0304 family)
MYTVGAFSCFSKQENMQNITVLIMAMVDTESRQHKYSVKLRTASYITHRWCKYSRLNSSWHSQLTLYARDIPNAVCEAPPEEEQVMLETCRGT